MNGAELYGCEVCAMCARAGVDNSKAGEKIMHNGMKWVTRVACLNSARRGTAARGGYIAGLGQDARRPHRTPVHGFVADSDHQASARLVSMSTLDKSNKKADILLGYPDLANYGPDKDPYFGPIVGRFGNRLKNGTFPLEGKTFHVSTNEGLNMLHGGKEGFEEAHDACVLPVSPTVSLGYTPTPQTNLTLFSVRLESFYELPDMLSG